MHRFCIQSTYSTGSSYAHVGVSREHTDDRIGLSCIRSVNAKIVPFDALEQYNGGCNHRSKSQHRDCLSSAHRYCIDALDGYQYAGISQEVPPHGMLIKCFQTTHKEHVALDVLSFLNSGCIFPDSDSDSCFSAASRYCVSMGYSGGITQEVNTDGMTVACYDADFTLNAFINRDDDFYLAQQQATQVCSIAFDIDNGDLLSQTPQFLKIETYDNRASSVPLHIDFEVSKEVAEISLFTHSNNLTIGAEISVSTQLPFFDGSDITLSESATSGVSLTSETRKISSYNASSSVEVSAGEGVVKEAIVQEATVSVPWTATVINGLGAEVTIGGQWRGTNAFNFRVEQEDIDGFSCSP